MVEEHLHRSGQPNEMNLEFMKKLKLRKVVYLSPDDPGPVFVHFLEDNNVELVRLGMNETAQTPWASISEEAVLDAFRIILDSKNYPLHVMDYQGTHRTGTVVGCLRKAQGWSLTSIFEEYRRYAGGKIGLANEQFIELFDTDLVHMPASPPTFMRGHGIGAMNRRR